MKTLPALLILTIGLSGSLFAQPQFKALLFTKTAGWHHVSINEGVDAIRNLANRHAFEVNWQENASQFNAQNLEQFDVIIFLNTTGDILNDEQQAAMEDFIRSGKGFVGIHSASDTEYDWEWYTQLVGRMFVAHPADQTAKIDVIDPGFPGLQIMPNSRFWTDEWYVFSEENVEGLNYLITVDENTYDPESDWGQGRAKGMGDFHPISWYQEFDGGRSFYTAMGHRPENYSDAIFMEHIFGGIFWAATGRGVAKASEQR
ncbi:MAG: ThuA domain-containing protein [Balneolaceae bacterium]